MSPFGAGGKSRLRELKVVDRDRKGTWVEELRPGQFVAFAKHAETGATLSADAEPFAHPDDVTCRVFDSLADAEAFGAARTAIHPDLQIDVFDHEGRKHPPLLTLLHPSQEHRRPANERHMRVRAAIAAALIVLALPLLWYDLWLHEARLILPTFLGINMIVVAGRTLLMNRLLRGAERTRLERLARLGHPARS